MEETKIGVISDVFDLKCNTAFDEAQQDIYNLLKENNIEAIKTKYTNEEIRIIVDSLKKEQIEALNNVIISDGTYLKDAYEYTIGNDFMNFEEHKYSHLTKKEKELVTIPVRQEEKINRNAQCVCGSGKKYKKCCINQH